MNIPLNIIASSSVPGFESRGCPVRNVDDLNKVVSWTDVPWEIVDPFRFWQAIIRFCDLNLSTDVFVELIKRGAKDAGISPMHLFFILWSEHSANHTYVVPHLMPWATYGMIRLANEYGVEGLEQHYACRLAQSYVFAMFGKRELDVLTPENLAPIMAASQKFVGSFFHHLLAKVATSLTKDHPMMEFWITHAQIESGEWHPTYFVREYYALNLQVIAETEEDKWIHPKHPMRKDMKQIGMWKVNGDVEKQAKMLNRMLSKRTHPRIKSRCWIGVVGDIISVYIKDNCFYKAYAKPEEDIGALLDAVPLGVLP